MSSFGIKSPILQSMTVQFRQRHLFHIPTAVIKLLFSFSAPCTFSTPCCRSQNHRIFKVDVGQPFCSWNTCSMRLKTDISWRLLFSWLMLSQKNPSYSECIRSPLYMLSKMKAERTNSDKKFCKEKWWWRKPSHSSAYSFFSHLRTKQSRFLLAFYSIS